MTHGVLSSLPSQLPRKPKGSRTKEWVGKTSLKEPKEMARVMLLFSLPSARTESVMRLIILGTGKLAREA